MFNDYQNISLLCWTGREVLQYYELRHVLNPTLTNGHVAVTLPTLNYRKCNKTLYTHTWTHAPAELFTDDVFLVQI